MFASRFRVVGVLAVAAMLFGACSSSAASPTTAGPATKVVATAPADQLIKAGVLTVCSDTSYPPQESLDANNAAIGSDIELINAIAARMGLTVSVKSTVFDSVIPALTGGSCDVIISAQNITQTRLQQVDMIPYFEAGQAFVLLKGNPQNIKTLDDLCGKTIAAEKGTTEADHIAGTGDYDATTGLSSICKSKGKPEITLKQYDKDTDALLALQSNTVQAHFTDEPVAGYEVAQGQGKYELAPSLTVDRAPEGISVTKNHTGLRDAVQKALQSMMDDGSYLQILTKWGVQSGAVTSAAIPTPAAS
ncbi:MAG: ABC transporter substrate-binding protein [Candidatus Limnocylindrales bacterium]